MAIDETELTKGQVRKLNALRKSVGDDLGEEAFSRSGRNARSRRPRPKASTDPVQAVKISEALAGFENDPKFKLGNHGYTIRRRKGHGRVGLRRIQERKDEINAPCISELEYRPGRVS